MFHMQLGGLSGMVSRVVRMSRRRVRVMRGGFVIAGFVVPGSFAVMPCGVFVMIRGLVMVLCGLL
jgi:pilus assembly protein TadC